MTTSLWPSCESGCLALDRVAHAVCRRYVFFGPADTLSQPEIDFANVSFSRHLSPAFSRHISRPVTNLTSLRSRALILRIAPSWPRKLRRARRRGRSLPSHLVARPERWASPTLPRQRALRSASGTSSSEEARLHAPLVVLYLTGRWFLGQPGHIMNQVLTCTQP